jgi:hypothetical protein
MRERVHLCGGTFAVGPVPEGGFQVTAVLPLPIGTAPGGVPGPGVVDTPETTVAPAAADMAGITFASHGGRG